MVLTGELGHAIHGTVHLLQSLSKASVVFAARFSRDGGRVEVADQPNEMIPLVT